MIGIVNLTSGSRKGPRKGISVREGEGGKEREEEEEREKEGGDVSKDGERKEEAQKRIFKPFVRTNTGDVTVCAVTVIASQSFSSPFFLNCLSVFNHATPFLPFLHPFSVARSLSHSFTFIFFLSISLIFSGVSQTLMTKSAKAGETERLAQSDHFFQHKDDSSVCISQSITHTQTIRHTHTHTHTYMHTYTRTYTHLHTHDSYLLSISLPLPLLVVACVRVGV